MLNQFSRTELAIGSEGVEALRGSTVAVLGLGGVGSIAAEALARSGVGRLILIDKDVVDVTNINRQIQAFHHTIGQSKALLMEERVKQVNPDIETIVLEMFYTEETYERLFEHPIDYVLDASDTVTYKIHIIKECFNRNIPIISCMGAANRMDPDDVPGCGHFADRDGSAGESCSSEAAQGRDSQRGQGRLFQRTAAHPESRSHETDRSRECSGPAKGSAAPSQQLVLSSSGRVDYGGRCSK